MRRTATVAIAATAVIATAALVTGCGSGKSRSSGTPHRSGGTTTASTSDSPAPAGSDAAAGAGANASRGAATGGGPTGSAAPTPAAQASCPVSTATLMAALRDNAKIYGTLAQPKDLTNAHCARGYALATTVPSQQIDPAQVVFAFDTKVGTWRAVNAGTDSVCESTVPADIAKELPGC